MNEPELKQAETKPVESANSSKTDSPSEIKILEMPAPEQTGKKRGPYKPRKPRENRPIEQAPVPPPPVKESITVEGMVGLWAGLGQTLCAVFRLKPLSQDELQALAAATVPVAKKYAADFAYTEELVLAGTCLAIFGMRESVKPRLVAAPMPLPFNPPTIPRAPEGKSFFNPGTLETKPSE
jgi:hypothetical protein